MVAIPGGGQGWSSRRAFLLAAIGAAVGLGNIWRFPALAGENGGGAFVLVYILCVFLIGAPLVLSEILLGRAGRRDAAGSVIEVAARSGASRRWGIAGALEIATAFVILCFYSVVAGWVLNYVWLSGLDLAGSVANGQPLRPAFAGLSDGMIAGQMGQLFASPGTMLVFHAIFMAVTVFIVVNGVHSGIERAASWLMPAFFALLCGLMIYGALTGEFAQAVAFLFTPDFSRLTPVGLNEALGQALFSLSLGSAALITYGSYIGRDVRLGSAALVVALADTAVALLSGLMIFPIVFAAGLDPAAGPVLIFQSLPVAFNAMPAGALVGFAFFILIFFAALTSSISLLEGPVAWAVNQLGWTRLIAGLSIGGLAFIVGIACILGYSQWSDVRPLGFWAIFRDSDILDTLDGLTGKLLLPVAALLVSLFVGWRADRALIQQESGLTGALFIIWRGLVAWLAPVAVALILLFGLFPGLLG